MYGRIFSSLDSGRVGLLARKRVTVIGHPPLLG
jgi:hypothetical protein